MNRRELLHRGGALTTVACLAGCLGTASRDGSPGRETTSDGDESGTSDDDSTTETGAEDGSDGSEEGFDGDFEGVRSDRDAPFRELSVGSRDGVAFPDNNRPHVVRVWNVADEPRELLVRVSRSATDLLDRTVEFAADAYLTVTLNEPADYRVAVGVAGEVPTTVAVERTLFDCNSSATDVGVAPDGSVESIEMSTAAGCYGPEITDADLSVGKSECGTENGASVAFDGERVRIEGTVRTATPQSDLALVDVTADQQSRTATVRVRDAGADDPEPGTQCVGTVPYEASVEFEYALPDEVVVVHENAEGTVEVARANRVAD